MSDKNSSDGVVAVDNQKPPPGGKATIRDVAKRAGVSEATVSYIVSGRRGGRSRISDATRKRVEAAAAQLGYIPNSAARNLRRQRTDRIVVAMPAMGPYNGILVKQIQAAADEHDSFALVVLAGSEQRELETLDQLLRGLADGVVVKDAQFLSAVHFRQLAASGLSLVVMDDITEADTFDVAHLHEGDACAQAVDMLLKTGHCRFAVFGHLSQPAEARKVHRYIDLLTERGVAVEKQTVYGEVTGRRDAYHAVQEMITLQHPPTALLAVTDRAAIGALLGARHAGLRVPEDVAVIGIGNIPETEITTPPLSTIGLRSLDFSAVSALLFSRMGAGEPMAGRMVTYEMELIQRGST